MFGYKYTTIKSDGSKKFPKIDEETTHLYCYMNNFTNLNGGVLPNGLLLLSCWANKLTNVDDFPDTIRNLNISCNLIKEIRKLPKDLKILDIKGNPLKNISGIWNCRLEYISYSQINLRNELQLYGIITGCEINESLIMI